VRRGALPRPPGRGQASGAADRHAAEAGGGPQLHRHLPPGEEGGPSARARRALRLRNPLPDRPGRPAVHLARGAGRALGPGRGRPGLFPRLDQTPALQPLSPMAEGGRAPMARGCGPPRPDGGGPFGKEGMERRAGAAHGRAAGAGGGPRGPRGEEGDRPEGQGEGGGGAAGPRGAARRARGIGGEQGHRGARGGVPGRAGAPRGRRGRRQACPRGGERCQGLPGAAPDAGGARGGGQGGRRGHPPAGLPGRAEKAARRGNVPARGSERPGGDGRRLQVPGGTRIRAQLPGVHGRGGHAQARREASVHHLPAGPGHRAAGRGGHPAAGTVLLPGRLHGRRLRPYLPPLLPGGEEGAALPLPAGPREEMHGRPDGGGADHPLPALRPDGARNDAGGRQRPRPGTLVGQGNAPPGGAVRTAERGAGQARRVPLAARRRPLRPGGARDARRGPGGEGVLAEHAGGLSQMPDALSPQIRSLPRPPGGGPGGHAPGNRRPRGPLPVLQAKGGAGTGDALPRRGADGGEAGDQGDWQGGGRPVQGRRGGQRGKVPRAHRGRGVRRHPRHVRGPAGDGRPAEVEARIPRVQLRLQGGGGQVRSPFH